MIVLWSFLGLVGAGVWFVVVLAAVSALMRRHNARLRLEAQVGWLLSAWRQVSAAHIDAVVAATPIPDDISELEGWQ